MNRFGNDINTVDEKIPGAFDSYFSTLSKVQGAPGRDSLTLREGAGEGVG